jgi:methylthioribose-1-phosphate isomerase
MINKLEYTDKNEIIFLDQTLLPAKEKYIRTRNYKDIISAIVQLKIRGAPLIGIAAAYGVVLGMANTRFDEVKSFEEFFYNLLDSFRNSRPTAKNLFYALDRIQNTFVKNRDKEPGEIESILLDEADAIYNEDIELCRRIGVNGADLIGDSMNILTHCNAGELATGGIGTSLGIITTARNRSKKIFVYVDETRPLLQGSRLTVYELEKNNIEYELIIDSMAANLMKEGLIDCVLVGADRIACNGDVVNKVGSYSLAVNCKYHNVPFYVAAPSTTIDFDINSGDEVIIEERDPDEVRTINGYLITDEETPVLNPAFDLVPNMLVSAIVTEYKVHYPTYNFGGIKHLLQGYIQSVSHDDEQMKEDEVK